MRKHLIVLGIALLMLFSCEAIKESITVPVNTSLTVNVPFTVSVTKNAGLSGKAATTYNFSASRVLEVGENVDMKAYINKIKSVDLKGVTVTIATLTGTEEVLTLDVAVSGVTGPVFSKNNITATGNNPFSPVITQAIQSQLDLVESKVINERKITITVSGTTNAAPLVLNAQLAFDAKFTCMPLN
jgi:hypothetical protein